MTSRGSHPPRFKLVYVTTDTKGPRCFLSGQLAFMRKLGFDVYYISSPDGGLAEIEHRERVTTISVPMQREIAPCNDLRSLLHLNRVLRQIRPHIINAGTPKAGLLAMMSARWTRIPIRFYSQWGLRLETTKGLKRFVLKTAEQLSSSCAHQVLCNSNSLKDQLVRLKLTRTEKIQVLGYGSNNGVDSLRFRPRNGQLAERTKRFRYLGMDTSAPVIGFVGRLTCDKGIADLFLAHEQLLERFPNLQLLLVGDFEIGDPLPTGLRRRLSDHPQVFLTGPVSDTSTFYPLFDLLAFPSYREGFPNAVLEASASALPVVAYAATGTVDAVQHGKTGTLVPVGHAQSLAAAIADYLQDRELCRLHGQAGRRRVVQYFQPEFVWGELANAYFDELHQRGLFEGEERLRWQGRSERRQAA